MKGLGNIHEEVIVCIQSQPQPFGNLQDHYMVTIIIQYSLKIEKIPRNTHYCEINKWIQQQYCNSGPYARILFFLAIGNQRLQNPDSVGLFHIEINDQKCQKLRIQCQHYSTSYQFPTKYVAIWTRADYSSLFYYPNYSQIMHARFLESPIIPEIMLSLAYQPHAAPILVNLCDFGYRVIKFIWNFMIDYYNYMHCQIIIL